MAFHENSYRWCNKTLIFFLRNMMKYHPLFHQNFGKNFVEIYLKFPQNCLKIFTVYTAFHENSYQWGNKIFLDRK